MGESVSSDGPGDAAARGSDASAHYVFGNVLENMGRTEDAIAQFQKAAAIISQLDLVISSDTSVVHLAGALGRPAWILLEYTPDWRWRLDREDNPWYPSARLFRQPKAGDRSCPIRQRVLTFDASYCFIESFTGGHFPLAVCSPHK